MGRFDRGTILTLAMIFVAVYLLWDTHLVYPLKILVVLLHEISHGVAAVATGGAIDHIEVNANQGGVCWTSGGVRFITLSAGYLGSMAWGAVILVLASRTRIDRFICGAFGLFLLFISLRFVENGFGRYFGFAAGALLAIGAWKLPEAFADRILKVIGLTSCLYAILDIKSDTIDRRGIGSDADMLAQLTGLPGVVWGSLWILLALVVSALALVLSAPGDGTPASEGAADPGRREAVPAGSGGAPPTIVNAAALIDELARSIPPKVKP